jgi:hypothetical protein
MLLDSCVTYVPGLYRVVPNHELLPTRFGHSSL